MKLFNKTIDRQLFKQYALGSDLSKQEVVVKIYNPFGAGSWYILNSDPQDPDYLWAIVDLGYGAEVGSVSRNDLESYRGKFGLGFERDLGFDPVNAEELYKGLRQGKFYAKGGGIDKYADLYGKDVAELLFLKKKGYAQAFNMSYSFSSLPNDVKMTQAINLNMSTAKNLGIAYFIGIDNNPDEETQISREMLDAISGNSNASNIVLYTNAGVDLHSKEKGIYKNIKVVKVPFDVIKPENNFAYGGETKNKYKSYKDFVNKNIGESKIVISVGSGGQSQPLGGATEESIEKQFKQLVINNFTDYEFSANYVSQDLFKEYNSFVKKFYNSLIENPKEFVQFWNEFVIESGRYDSIYAIRPATYDEKGKYIESREWIDDKWVKNYVPHYPDLIFSKYKKEMPSQLIKEYQDYLKEYAGDEIGYSFADGGEVSFIDYNDSQIMHEPHYNKYYANDVEFDTLQQAKDYIDSGEVDPKIRDAYSKGMFADGGNLSRDQKFVNKSEDYEVEYSKGTNRKGYEKHSFAEGGNLRQSLEDVLKQDVTFLKFSSNRAYSNFERLQIPFINVHDYDFNHYYIIKTENLEKVLDYINKGVIVVKKKFSSDDLGFDYKGSKSFADGGLFQPISTQKQEERQKLKENIIKALFVDKKNPITEVALTYSNSEYSVPNINKQDIRNMVLEINQTKKYKNIIVYTNSYGVLSLKVENSFKDGGDLEDFSDNQRMIMNQNVELEHHHEELEDILKDKTPVPAWAVAKMATATESVSDVTHYLDGQKELMEDESEDEAEKQNIIKNHNVVEPINVSAGTKAEMTKKFTDDALGNLKGFLQAMNEIELRDDYTFDYKDEQFEIEPIINSDQNGVSNAVFTVFDGDGQEVGEVAYSSDGGKQKFTANSKLFGWNDTKFEDGGFMNGVYADGGYFDGAIPKVSTYMSNYAEGGNTAIDNLNKNTQTRENMISYIVNMKSTSRMSDRQYDALEKRISEKSFIQLKKEYDALKANSSYADGGNTSKNVVIQKSGQGAFTQWNIIDAKSPFSFSTEVFFDSKEEAEKFATKKGFNIVTSFENEYANGGSFDDDFDGIAYAKTKGKESIDWDKELKEYAGEKEYQRLTAREKEEIISDLQRDRDRSNSYAEGGEIAKAEILGFSKNIMGTTDIEMKITGMRKPQNFIVYPIGKDDAGSVITIQSETRIGQINLVKGVGVMSQSHSSGAYFVHLQMDKLTPFTLSESDLEDLKISIFKTSGSNVGSSIVKSDNSGASRILAKGGDLGKYEGGKNFEIRDYKMLNIDDVLEREKPIKLYKEQVLCINPTYADNYTYWICPRDITIKENYGNIYIEKGDKLYLTIQNPVNGDASSSTSYNVIINGKSYPLLHFIPETADGGDLDDVNHYDAITQLKNLDKVLTGTLETPQQAEERKIRIAETLIPANDFYVSKPYHSHGFEHPQKVIFKDGKWLRLREDKWVTKEDYEQQTNRPDLNFDEDQFNIWGKFDTKYDLAWDIVMNARVILEDKSEKDIDSKWDKQYDYLTSENKKQYNSKTKESKLENGGDVLERGKKSGWGNVSEEEDDALAWYRSLSMNQQKEVDKHLESYKANLTEEKFQKRGLSVRDFGRTYHLDKLIHIWKSEGSPEPQDSFANGGSTTDVYADGGQIRVGDKYKYNWTDNDGNQGYTIREVIKQNITSSKDFKTKVMIMKVVESSMPEQVGKLEEEYKPSFKKRIGWGLEIPMHERMPKLTDENYAKGGRLEDKLTKLEKKKSDLESKLFEAKLAENKVMNNMGFGAGMRRSKVSISTTRTDSLKARIEAVEKEIEQTKEDMLPKKPKYILKADIKTVTVKRNGKKVTYNSADVLNGANVLEKGGDLTSKANYVAKRDVVSVELKDGTVVKPVNGYWIKKGAEPIGAEPKATQSLNTLSDNEKEIDEKLALFTKSDKEFNRLQSDSNKEFDKKTKLEKERLALIKKGVSNTEEIDAKIKDAKEKGNLYSEQAMDLLKKYQQELIQSKNSSSSANKISTTEIRKDQRGNWRAETTIDNFNSYDWRITTLKTYSGQLISSAQGGKFQDSGSKGISMFKYTMYEDPYHTLEVSKPSRLTEKVVAEQHAKALAKFKKFMETGVFKGGGKISTFDKVSAKIAKEFEGKPVVNKYQEEYGKYYSKQEAEIVGDKIAGKRRAMDVDKKAFGGLFSHVKKLTDSKPKYPNLEGKQVFLKTGQLVQVFTQSDNTLSVLEVGKMTSGVRPHSIDISEVNISSFKDGGKTDGKTSNKGTETLKQANELARKIRMEGESWLDAKKRAFAELKKAESN